MKKIITYIGTYNEPITAGSGEICHGNRNGIYSLEFNSDSGDFTHILTPTKTANPSFLCTSADGKYLYTVNELDKINGQPAGMVSAFLIRPDASLTLINQQPTAGCSPCHLCVDSLNRCLFTANYSSGSISVFPLGKDGAIGKRTQLIEHTGHGTNPNRQEGPHAHCVYLNQTEDVLYTADLGIDRVDAYSINYTRSILSVLSGGAYIAVPGAGCRTIIGSKDGRFLYVTNELASTISVLSVCLGSLTCIQTISSLPEDCTLDSNIAELALSTDEKYLYASNRGHNSIAAFEVSASTGLLTSLQYISTGGSTPRSFTLDPSENWLVAANQDSGNLAIFARDIVTGKLKLHKIEQIPTPVCIRMHQMHF